MLDRSVVSSPAPSSLASSQLPVIARGTPLFALDESLERIDQFELARVMAAVEIHGSLFLGQRALQVSDLSRLGMEPNYRVQIEDRTVYLAGQLYPLPKGRVGIVAYVQDESSRGAGKEVYTVRSYYRSSSQGGSWRILPEIVLFGNKLGWYSKGFDESSLALPAELLAAIQQVRLRGGISANLTEADRNLLFAGPVRSSWTREHMLYQGEGETYTAVMERQGRQLNQDTWTGRETWADLTPPSRAGVSDPRNAPDLDECKGVFVVESALTQDRVPAQLLYRANRYDDEPELAAVEPETGLEGDVLVRLRQGVTLVFPVDGEKRGLLGSLIDRHGMAHQLEPIVSLEEEEMLWRDQLVPEMDLSIRYNDAGHPFAVSFSNGEVVELLSGLMTVRSFHSREIPEGAAGKLEYLFHTDQLGRTMIGSIMERGTINQLGIHSKWTASRSLMMPLLEYPQQAGDYGDIYDGIGGYVSMWPRYLSQIPLIRDFHQRYVSGFLPELLIEKPSEFELDRTAGQPTKSDLIDDPFGRELERLGFSPADLLTVLPEEAPPQRVQYVPRESAKFSLGEVNCSARFEQNGDLVLSFDDRSRSIRYQRKYLLKHPIIEFGSSVADIRLDDPSVAPRHARMEFLETGGAGDQRISEMRVCALSDLPVTIGNLRIGRFESVPFIRRIIE